MKTLPSDALIYAEHPADVIAKGAALAQASRPFALITSLAIEGGAAREVGALALVDGSGQMTGYLSNGCIDRDIRHHALEALGTGRKTLIRYGEGSRFADLKLPCGGALSVLIDPAPDAQAILQAANCLAARQSATMTFRAEDDSPAAVSRTFVYTPRRRLVLAGRGAIFRSVSQIGQAMDFDIYLLSPDADDLAAIGHLSQATPCHLTTPDAVPALDVLDAHAAFLTLFHDHDWEPPLLRAALETDAHFIGSLGSRRTHKMRCETLLQMGVPEVSLGRLNGPIGLVPSLRDASSIAASALAQIVAAFQISEREPKRTRSS